MLEILPRLGFEFLSACRDPGLTGEQVPGYLSFFNKLKLNFRFVIKFKVISFRYK